MTAPTNLDTSRRLRKVGTIIPALALRPMPRTWSQDVPFLNRLLLHYGIYRRYPLRPWPALKNAWRVAWR